MDHCFVVDLGGTKMRFGISGISMASPEIEISTPESKDAVISEIISNLTKLSKKYAIEMEYVIISCPGLITKEGKVEKALYFPLTGVNVKDVIGKQFNCKVFVENDANIQALGKYQNNDLLYMVIGTAVGGAYVSDGEILKGYNGFAGEFGHIYIGGEEKCFCGNSGCLDTVVSGTKILDNLGDLWWDRLSDSDVIEYLKFAGICTGHALARLSILFDPSEITLCGIICKYEIFRKSVIDGFNEQAWNVLRILFYTNTWLFVYKGALKIFSDCS